jgi:hypothetical protein
MLEAMWYEQVPQVPSQESLVGDLIPSACIEKKQYLAWPQESPKFPAKDSRLGVRRLMC